MKLALRILLFGIALNLAVGLVLYLIPALNYNPEYLRGATYNDSKITSFTGQFNATINPTSEATDTTNFIDNIIDKLNLGIFNKLREVLDNFLYGFLNLVGKTWLGLDDRIMFFMKAMLTVAYVLAFINLFSGKDFGEG